MAWTVKTEYKKSVTQIDYWEKDGVTIAHEIGWRWGEFTFHKKPDFSEYIPSEGCDLYEIGDFDIETLDDGCWEDYTVRHVSKGLEMSDEQLQALVDQINDDGDELFAGEKLADLGWYCSNSELYVEGPLIVEEV